VEAEEEFSLGSEEADDVVLKVIAEKMRWTQEMTLVRIVMKKKIVLVVGSIVFI
jgi:hypothetical protein